RSPAARDPPPRARASMPRRPGLQRARRPPPVPLPATPRATRALRWQGTRNSRSPASGTSHEPPEQREETSQEQRPTGGLLHRWIRRRRERRAADAGNEPAGLERERPLVHLAQGRQDERQGEGAERAQPGREPCARGDPPA